MSKEANFSAYLERFVRRVGDIDVGQYGHFKDRLVRRLDRSEFEVLFAKHETLSELMSVSMQRGDTMDESLLLEIRRAEFDLLIEESKFIL